MMPLDRFPTKSIVIIGTLDTKGREVDFIRSEIEKEGCSVIVVDVGVLGEPLAGGDYSREVVSKIGGKNLTALIESSKQGSDRADATLVMIKGAISIIEDLLSRGELHGIMALGGSTGTAIGMSVMKTLPVGIPKLMVTSHIVHARQAGEKDIALMQTPADIMGLNRIMKRSLGQAAGAIVGMVNVSEEEWSSDLRPMVGITALGVTTPAVMEIMAHLEKNGQEVIVFHNRTGILEELIQSETIEGVIDLSPGELVWAYVAGISPERQSRLDIVHRVSIPMILVPGSFDMIILSYPQEDTLRKYKNRLTSKHGPYVTLVRTNLEEIRILGKIVAEKANAAKGPTAIMIPLKGFSSMDKEGQAFHDTALAKEFAETVRINVKKDVRVIEVENHINDNEFAQKVYDIYNRMKGVGK